MNEAVPTNNYIRQDQSATNRPIGDSAGVQSYKGKWTARDSGPASPNPVVECSACDTRKARHAFQRAWTQSTGSFGAVRANNRDLRAVRQAELVQDLPHVNFDGAFLHPEPACNGLVRVAMAQEFQDSLLPHS